MLIADSVGLGKTFLAGELIRQTVERERKRVLLIAPATLAERTWARFKARFQLYVETVSFERLLNAPEFGGVGRPLDSRLEDYSLIVIDEAHAFRHSDTQRAAALRKLLQGDPPKQVVLMSATPVKNSLWDLYNLIKYFARHDSVFADIGIASLERQFKAAAKEDPYTLKPDVLFDILDATTVRRTRHFVKKYYPLDKIELKGGERVTIQFPRPHVRSVTYDLERALPGLVREIELTLAPEDSEPDLTMARYWPSRYKREGGVIAREVALVGLVRTGLLKRFESSARAFARSPERMIEHHGLFLQGLDRGVILESANLEDFADAIDEEVWDAVIADAEPIDASQYDIARLRKAVRADRALLQKFYERAVAVRHTDDPKLAVLAEELHTIARRASEIGATEEHQHNSRKVLIFSHFADTVEWIADYLEEKLETDRRLHAYRGRMAVVRGTEGYEEVGRKEAIYGFAPVSSEAPSGYQADKYDIGLDDEVIPGVQAAERNFADAMHEIGRIQSGDAALFEQGGEDSHAHSGEEYRQELRKALSEGMEERIRSLPGAAGSGLRLGAERGHFFCARIASHVRFRFVPLGTDKAILREALGCLRHITCTPVHGAIPSGRSA